MSTKITGMFHAAAMLIAASHTAALAGVTVFTDRAAWEAAAGGVVGSENLNNGASLASYTPAYSGTGITSYFGNGVNFRLVAPDMQFISAITNNRENWSWNDSSLRLTAGGSTGAQFTGGTLVVQPSASIGNVGGFGFDWESTGGRAEVSLNFLGGTTSDIVDIPANLGPGNRFFGIISDGGANVVSMNLITYGYNTNQIHFDNFALGATPAPGALALLGMGGLLTSRRRR